MHMFVFLVGFTACTQATPKESDTQAPVLASPLGDGDGTPTSVQFTYIVGANERVKDPRDLGFDAAGILWVANRATDQTILIFNPGSESQSYDIRKEGAAEHFMEEIAAVSFDGGVQFGSCGESENTYNDMYDGNDYMGPVLWSTDLNIFGVENPIGLGSHLDMSHESPLCVGIAWETANVYWAFDGRNNALVRHDFQQDHGIGMDEHFDGIIDQFSEPVMTRVPEAPGHLVWDEATRRLYAADTGGGRIVWLNVDSGEQGRSLRPHDPGVVRVSRDQAEWGTVVEGLDRPGGLAQYGDRLIVGEWGTGLLHEFSLDGELLYTLDTGFGPERLYGIEYGPDGKLWVIDKDTGVYRIDP